MSVFAGPVHYIRGLLYAKEKIYAYAGSIPETRKDDPEKKEAAEYVGFKDTYEVKKLLKQERRKQRKQAESAGGEQTVTEFSAIRRKKSEIASNDPSEG